jgi:Protein of unknown function C-terminus (DUF2399)
VNAVPEGVAPIALRGVPEGLHAKPLYRYRSLASGERVPVRSRQGLLKLNRIELTAASALTDIVVLDERDERFLLGAERRSWQSIERRYGDRAWDACVEFARAGIVRLRCDVNDRLEIGRLIDWTLTTEWSRKRASRASGRDARRAAIQSRAHAAADDVQDICIELADALRGSPPHLLGLPGLIAVALDLRDGIVNPGPRSFSQRHFGSTKAHDDVARVIERLGVPDWVADATGVRRSSRIGVAGRISVSANGTTVLTEVFAGPVIFRADQQDLVLTLTDHAAPLVLVENLQAAETLADQRPDLAIIYTGGMPGRATVNHVARLAEAASVTVIATDADLGGIRIAEQLLLVAPGARVSDVGAMPHQPQPAWSANSGYRRSIEGSLGGAASRLAEAVLARGYAVEQELVIVQAVDACLAA